MVDIRPNALPDAILPLRSGDAIIVDQGADGVRKTDPISMTDSVAPVATQSEAQTGTDNTKRMTPLRTKQSIASEVGVTLASNSQGVKADSAVQSVNGKTGNSVTLVKADVGLGNVDNTSDANKPVSTAQQAALNLKANTATQVIAGAGLTGGGDLSADRTVNVGEGTGISVTADAVSLDAASIASLAKADTALQAPGGAAGQILAKNSATTNDVVWVSSEAATAVSYGPQTLTSSQQQQARDNIGALGLLETAVNSSLLGGKSIGDIQSYGTNANGIYWRFDSGLQITCRVSGTTPISSPTGSIFVNGAALGPYTHAAEFAAPPYAVYTGNNLSSIGHSWAASVSAPTVTQSASIQLFRATADAGTYYAQLIHIGRWK